MARTDRRPTGRERALDLFEKLEDGIYGLIAVFLLVGAALLLFGAGEYAYRNFGHTEIKNLVIGFLDQALLVFMVAELVHTVRITLRDRSLAAEPFLIVGLIAGVRRILIVTAKNEDIQNGTPFQFQVFSAELLLLILLVVSMVIALFLWSKAYPGGSRGGHPPEL